MAEDSPGKPRALLLNSSDIGDSGHIRLAGRQNGSCQLWSCLLESENWMCLCSLTQKRCKLAVTARMQVQSNLPLTEPEVAQSAVAINFAATALMWLFCCPAVSAVACGCVRMYLFLYSLFFTLPFSSFTSLSSLPPFPVILNLLLLWIKVVFSFLSCLGYFLRRTNRG